MAQILFGEINPSGKLPESSSEPREDNGGI